MVALNWVICVNISVNNLICFFYHLFVFVIAFIELRGLIIYSKLIIYAKWKIIGKLVDLNLVDKKSLVRKKNAHIATVNLKPRKH